MWGFPHNTYMPRISASERTATRQRLIDAGKTEFADRGLAGARFDEISLAAGHAKGTIYNYFVDKESLFFTIVEDWCQQLVEGFVPDEGRSAADDLLEIARLDVEIARKDPDLARVVINHVPPLADQHRASLESALEPGLALLVEVVSWGQSVGSLADTDSPLTVARLFLALLSGIEQEALAQGTQLSLDDVVPMVDRLVVSGFVR